MKQADIKKTIDMYNEMIESCFYPNKFTLNNTILDISQKIRDLQNICEHQYENGYCIYCYKSEESN